MYALSAPSGKYLLNCSQTARHGAVTLHTAPSRQLQGVYACACACACVYARVSVCTCLPTGSVVVVWLFPSILSLIWWVWNTSAEKVFCRERKSTPEGTFHASCFSPGAGARGRCWCTGTWEVRGRASPQASGGGPWHTASAPGGRGHVLAWLAQAQGSICSLTPVSGSSALPKRTPY